MKQYAIKQHVSGKYRVVQLLNNVLSFVNTNKKYFKTEPKAISHIKQLIAQDNHRARLKKRNKHLLVDL